MPSKCAAFGCKSGYASTTNSAEISFHKFPTEAEVLAKWLRNLSREPTFQPTQHSRVCSLHFVESDFITDYQDCNSSRKRAKTDNGVTRTKRRLKEDAVPTQFQTTSMPAYFTKNPPVVRSNRATSAQRHEASIAQQEKREQEFFAGETLTTLDDVAARFATEPAPSGFAIFQSAGSINLMLMAPGPPPTVKSSIIVNSRLEVAVYHGKQVVSPKQYGHIISPESAFLSSSSQLMNLMAFVKSAFESDSLAVDHKQAALESLELLQQQDHVTDAASTCLTFLIEQLKLLDVDKHARRYSPELLVFSYILFSVSSAAYQRVLETNSLVLPSIKTLRRVTRRMDSTTGLGNREYLKLRYDTLQAYETNVILLIDEIYLSKRVEMSGGELHGLTEEGNVAQTALCFMVKSAMTKYRDLVGIFPMNNLKAETLHQCYLRVMPMLHNIGFNVVAICVDNAAANRRFYTHFLCSGRLDVSVTNQFNGQKLFLIFDPTHNLKNLYNNFLSKREFVCPKFPPIIAESSRALFADVESVYHLEEDKPVKMAHKLTNVVLHPTSLEKVNVQLAVALFHESTINALKHYGFRQTASVLEVCHKLWNVLNVRTTTIGKHKRDLTRDPVRSSLDWKLTYLKEFADFLETWENSKTAGLTAYTFGAVRQTCRAMAALVQYLLDCCGFSYVLMGKIQSDNIEARFGWIRQLSGGNYFISMRQLTDSDKKIKAISLLKYSGLTVKDIDCALQQTSRLDQGQLKLAEEIHSELLYNFTPEKSDLVIIYYVCGFCARSLVRTKKCESCRETLVCDTPSAVFDFEEPQQVKDASDFLAEVDRGGLLWPQEHLFQLGIMCWRTFMEVKSTPKLRDKFLSAANQRALFYHVMDLVLADNYQILFGRTHCTNGHELVQEVTNRFFNCMAKNMTKQINQVDATAALQRKLKKLTSSGGKK